MRVYWKKSICGFLAVLMCASLLGGCGKASGGKASDANASVNKNAVYQDTLIELDPEIGNVDMVVVSGDVMYAAGSNYDEDKMTSTYNIYSSALDGTGIKKIYEYREEYEKYPDAIPFEESVAEMESAAGETAAESSEVPAEVPEAPADPSTYTGENISSLTGDGEGNLIGILSTWVQTEEEYTTQMHLVKFDREGSRLWSTDLDSDSYIDSVVCGAGKIMAIGSGEIFLFDENGQPLSRIEHSDDVWISRAAILEDGRAYVCYYQFDGESGRDVLAQVDFQTGKLADPIDVPWSNKGFNLMQGIGYDLFLQNNMMIAGYNIGDDSYTEVLNFIDSDIDASNLNFICATGKDSFLMSAYNTEDWSNELYRLDKVDPADVKEKTVITLGMLDNDYLTSGQVIKFNKSNDAYRIKLILYSDYSTDDSMTGAVTQLNNDISGGKMPDILLTDSYSMPLESYMKKGVFEDLYTWIDQDPEMNREDFMPNVLEAYSEDGKLYQIVPCFSISTVAAKSSLVGDTPGWTMDDVLKLQSDHPDSELFDMWTRDNVLTNCMAYVGYQFIRDENGKPDCDFESDEFIKMLEWAKTFPEEIDYSAVDDNYWAKYEMMWREDKILLQSSYLSSFGDFKYNRGVTFGEPVTYIGYPTTEGNGAVLQTNNAMAMSAQSKNKEGAWQFIRYYLTDEYQESDNIWGFPVKISALQKLGEEATKPYTYTDENGNEVEVEDTYWIGDQEITIDPLTMDEVNGYIEYMKTVNRVYSLNNDVLNIITEEAASFFAGQKSASEVAEVIQKRAKLFLAENS